MLGEIQLIRNQNKQKLTCQMLDKLGNIKKMKRRGEVFLQILYQTIILILIVFQVGRKVGHLLINKSVVKIRAGIVLKFLLFQINLISTKR
jgi:hypothetical protein